jgi:LPXTG-site transpeptidase (sortase) family protein
MAHAFRRRRYARGVGSAVVVIALVGIVLSLRASQPVVQPKKAAQAATVQPHVQSKTFPPMSLVQEEPARIIIPKLAVQAVVERVGRTKDDEMQAPASKDTVGWFAGGYIPGSLGNAVMAGHSWHAQGRGVFWQLDRLRPGDQIRLETATQRQTFTVTKTHTYPARTTLVQDIFGPSDRARLNLITCVGKWNPQDKSYTDRLVVFTEFTREQPLAPNDY